MTPKQLEDLKCGEKTKKPTSLTIDNINKFISENKDPSTRAKKRNHQDIYKSIIDEIHSDRKNWLRLIPDYGNWIVPPDYHWERDKLDLSGLDPMFGGFEDSAGSRPMREYQDIKTFEDFVNKYGTQKIRDKIKELVPDADSYHLDTFVESYVERKIFDDQA